MTHLEIPLFPLNAVLFPRTRLPLRIFEERYKKLFQDSLKEGARFGIVLIKEGLEVGGPATPFDVGTMAEIESVDHHGDSIFVLCRGTQRFRIHELKTDQPYLVGRVEPLPEPEKASASEAAAAAELEVRFRNYLEHLRAFASAMGGELRTPEFPAGMGVRDRVFSIAFTLPLELSQKQVLLETRDLGELILRLSELLESESSFLRPASDDPSIA